MVSSGGDDTAAAANCEAAAAGGGAALAAADASAAGGAAAPDGAPGGDAHASGEDEVRWRARGVPRTRRQAAACRAVLATPKGLPERRRCAPARARRA
jgi:hypothetical protein